MKKLKVFVVLIFVLYGKQNLNAQTNNDRFSGKTITLTSGNYTQQINKDSVNKAETAFQLYDLNFLNSSSIKDSSIIKNNLYNKSTYISTAIFIRPKERK
jgi:hypothetical protein